MEISKLKNGIKGFLADTYKKSIPTIIYQFIDLWVLHKEIPIHYFSRFLYRKEFSNYRDFIPTKKYFKLIYSDRVQDPFFVSILNNKLFFSFFCEQHKIPVPKLIGYNGRGSFYYSGKIISVSTISELTDYFEVIFKESATNRIFLKSLSTKGGTGIICIDKMNVKDQLCSFGNEILRGSFIHQVSVIQHPKINTIYPTSLNTIRFDVCADNNEIIVLGAVMRFGAEGSVIDNRSKGGFFVPINNEDGTLLKKGYKKMSFGGAIIVKHPDTLVVFDGFKIPYFKEAKSMAIRLSELIPNKIVGWDIAISEQGPVLIEGNHDSAITMTELQYGGYLKHPVIKKYLKSL